MIYYELSLSNDAMAAIDSYRHFLSNDALIPELRKERNYNFIRIVNDLINQRKTNR